MEEKVSYARELTGNLKRKVKSENMKQEIARLDEALQVIQKDEKMTSENQKELLGKSFKPENSASDDTTERRARAQQVKLGLADQAKKDDGQKNGESQTHEAAPADGVKIQLLCDGKLILHKIV